MGLVMKPTKFKTIQHYHEPGDLHEFTFSCFRRQNLLTNDAWRRYLAQAIDEAGREYGFHLVAFVFMPNHVHLLTWPVEEQPRIADYLKWIKRSSSASIKNDLSKAKSSLLRRLTVQEATKQPVFRFWEKGPGYDRNLNQPGTVQASIDYLHRNPVRRGLVTESRRWKWSSARFYESDGQLQEPELPKITLLPAEFWN